MYYGARHDTTERRYSMRTKTVLEEGMHRGFKRGMNAVVLGDVPKLRKDLRKVIGGKTACKMQYYINGTTITRKDVAKKIERVFAKYNVTPDMIWDN